MADVIVPETLMTIDEYWVLAEEIIWPNSKKRSGAKKICDSCCNDAKLCEKHKKAPLLPRDFEGKCPRCGGELRNSIGF